MDREAAAWGGAASRGGLVGESLPRMGEAACVVGAWQQADTKRDIQWQPQALRRPRAGSAHENCDSSRVQIRTKDDPELLREDGPR